MIKKSLRIFLTVYLCLFLIGASKAPASAPIQWEKRLSTQNALSDISYSCMRPYWFASEQIFRCYLPLIPNEYGQSKDMGYEIFKRVIIHFWAIPLMLVSLPLLYFGNTCFLIARLFSTTDYQFLYYPNKEAKVNKLKVLHLNTCMLQGQLPFLFGGITPASWRINQLITFIERHNPDVVLLSEVNGCVAKQLCTKLSRQYGFFFFRPGVNYNAHFSINPFGHDAQLYVATKVKPTAPPQFHPFHQQGHGKHSLIKRGYFKIDFEQFSLYFTHLHPDKTYLDKGIRHAQMLEIEETMSNDYRKSIMVGDLNIDYLHEKSEYEISITDLGYKPLGVIPEDSKKTYTNAFNAFIEKKEKEYEFSDYILSLHSFNLSGEIVPTYVEPPMHGYSSSLSDHDGLLFEIELSE